MITLSTSAPFLGHMRVEVTLPPGFRDRRTPLPFLILCDAQNQGTNRGAYGGWHTDSIALSLMRSRKLRSIVLVGLTSPSNRDRAYAPPPWGRAGLLADHIANSVIPMLRPRFKLTTDRNHIGIIGASFASNFAIEAGLFRPDTFGLCGAFSAAPHAGESLHAMVAKRQPLPFHRLYIDSGTLWAYDNPHGFGGDSTVFNRRLIELAKSRMPRGHFWGRICAGHYHNEEFWRKRIGPALQFLFRPNP
ncbi:MAG: alpha/beta hydrolase-fold protein [Candidatus Hydrogenedentota bacterium]